MAANFFSLFFPLFLWAVQIQFFGFFSIQAWNSDLFSRVLFSFLPPLLTTPFPPLFSALYTPFSPSKSALFCRERGTAQSLERGSFRMDLSTKFGKETPSRNLHEERADWLSSRPMLLWTCKTCERAKIRREILSNSVHPMSGKVKF